MNYTEYRYYLIMRYSPANGKFASSDYYKVGNNINVQDYFLKKNITIHEVTKDEYERQSGFHQLEIVS